MLRSSSKILIETLITFVCSWNLKSGRDRLIEGNDVLKQGREDFIEDGRAEFSGEWVWPTSYLWMGPICWLSSHLRERETVGPLNDQGMTSNSNGTVGPLGWSWAGPGRAHPKLHLPFRPDLSGSGLD